uniref:Uncharacterized protein n=1 Tax=viral metagenome TaxID=1070528 RepID=A0A6M3Y0A7_9ZZZZ
MHFVYCSYCKKLFTIKGMEEEKWYFCPECGKQLGYLAKEHLVVSVERQKTDETTN